VIVDSSALFAIALDEPQRTELVGNLDAADIVGIGAPTVVEAGIVLSARTGEDATDLLTDLLAAADAVVIEFGEAHVREALQAWWRYGGSRHPAGLNLGDCLAYAAARVADDALLAKGDDFAQTDIRLA
jgi:ribonuclease VapC